MSKKNGFVQLRRGVWEHLRDGRMSHMDALAFIYILGQADTRSGVWNGSAGALAGELSISSRTARDVLERLSVRDYLKRFTIPGKHSCYPIAVHKFLITDGEHGGEHLNAKESTSKDDLRYFRREQRVEDYGEHGVEESAAQKRIEIRNKKQTPNHSSPSAPQSGFEAFYKSYPLKKAPARARRVWLKIEAADVPAVMAGLERHKLSEQWHREGGRFIPYPATFLNDQRWKDELETTSPDGTGNNNGRIPTTADCRPTH
jgi:hypothetical protein